MSYSVAIVSWPLIVGTGLSLAGSLGVLLTLARGRALSFGWVVGLAVLVPVAAGTAVIYADLAGWAATGLSLSMRVPQLVKTLRTRSSSGLSKTTWAVSATASGLWVVYGFLIGSWQVVVADGWSLVCAVAVISLARSPRETR